MTVRLRTHHLLCLLTYVGRGYSPAFVENMDQVAARLSEGREGILVVEGPDDVCTPLLRGEDEPHCLEASARERDARAAADVAPLMGKPVQPGARLMFDGGTVARLREVFAAGAVRSACGGCEWAATCTAVARAAFAGTLLQGTAAAVATRLTIRPHQQGGPGARR